MPLSRLVTATGLHENTLRGHLDALSRAGLVRRERGHPNGRGRPAWLWSGERGDGGGAREYAGLAGALARTLKRTSAKPAADAIEAGRSWGHELAAGRVASSAAPREQVNALLDDLGFAPQPEPDSETVRLTQCPLLDLAREHPEIVCNVHLGLVGGALEQIGAEDVDTELVPFAEPGACLLHLRGTGR